MINNKDEWDAWFERQKKGCKQYQKENLEKSVELKLAVNKGDFQAAESLVIGIIGDNKHGIFEEWFE